MLLKTDQESLCLTCHAGVGNGSALDVEDGVSTSSGAALRGGGFAKSGIDASNPSALYYYNASRDSVSLQEGKIPTKDPVDTTSRHGMGATGAWGYTLSGAGSVALTSPLECGSCHDPHGNGNYRLLNTVPGGVSNAAMSLVSVTVTTVQTKDAAGNVTGTYTVAEYTTNVQHYLGVGNTVKIAGVGTGFDGTVSVWATPSYTTFQVLTTQPVGAVTPAGTPTATNAGQAVLDADPAFARVYTTTDYWKVNDETTPNITVGTTSNVKAFIGSIAAWCTQCHTRYQTGPSGTYKNATDDAVFTYRHRGNRVTNTNKTNNVAYPNQVNAANCIQCHVAHGSNAAFIKASTTDLANNVNYPGTLTAEDSSLLRISNRGVCQMCHNK